MTVKNPLDELESLLKERQQRRPSYLKVLLDAIPVVRQKAFDWFNYEAEVAKKEIELLEQVMPEDTQKWKAELQKLRIKFDKASESLNKIAEKVKKGEITSISEIYQRESEQRTVPHLLTLEEKEEEEALNLASSFLDIIDVAQNLEKLIQEIEREAARTLLLRRLVKIELQTK